MALPFSSNIADAQTIPLVIDAHAQREYRVRPRNSNTYGDDSLNTVTSHVDHYDSVYANSYRTCHPASGTGTQQTPSNQIILASLIFNPFIMSPLLTLFGHKL